MKLALPVALPVTPRAIKTQPKPKRGGAFPNPSNKKTNPRSGGSPPNSDPYKTIKSNSFCPLRWSKDLFSGLESKNERRRQKKASTSGRIETLTSGVCHWRPEIISKRREKSGAAWRRRDFGETGRALCSRVRGDEGFLPSGNETLIYHVHGAWVTVKLP